MDFVSKLQRRWRLETAPEWVARFRERHAKLWQALVRATRVPRKHTEGNTRPAPNIPPEDDTYEPVDEQEDEEAPDWPPSWNEGAWSNWHLFGRCTSQPWRGEGRRGP